MLISKDKYEIVDIKEADFIPTITNVLICFVVNTDIDKSNFLKEKYDEIKILTRNDFYAVVEEGKLEIVDNKGKIVLDTRKVCFLDNTYYL